VERVPLAQFVDFVLTGVAPKIALVKEFKWTKAVHPRLPLLLRGEAASFAAIHAGI
jgi:hypothetical protein